MQGADLGTMGKAENKRDFKTPTLNSIHFSGEDQKQINVSDKCEYGKYKQARTGSFGGAATFHRVAGEGLTELWVHT